MSVLTVTKQGDPILSQRLLDVPLEELPKLQQLIDDMIDTMRAENGIGLAANQVGIALRLAIIGKEAWDGQAELVIVNPRMVMGPKTKLFEEGCLSVPRVFGWVKRSDRVRVKAWDRHGNKLDIKAKGLLAHVLQHEIDHLEGILFVQKAEGVESVGLSRP